MNRAKTAVGTAITSALLGTSLGTLSPPLVAVTFGVLAFVPLVVLIRRREDTHRPTDPSPSGPDPTNQLTPAS